MMSEQDKYMPIRISEQMMIQYLLGELPEAWQAQFEERLFTDPDCYTRLQVVEENLIDEYVRGKLPADRQERFESHYLIFERRRRKVAFARTLIQSISELPAPSRLETTNGRQTLVSWRKRPTASRIAFVALALMVLIGGAWIVIEMARLRKQQDQLKADLAILQQREKANKTASQPIATADIPSPSVQVKQNPDKSSKSVHSHSNIVTQTLRPGRDRDAEAQPGEMERPDRFTIPAGTRLIRLRLKLGPPDKYPTYRATLMSADGHNISLPSHVRLKPDRDGQTVVVDLPAGLLARGDYVLTLLGVADSGKGEEISDYFFTVLKH
jgi:anti-sigma factor RsiW